MTRVGRTGGAQTSTVTGGAQTSVVSKGARIDRRALFASGSAAALLAAVGVSADAAPARGGILKAALSGGDRAENWLTLPGGRFLQAARNAVFETLTEIAPDGTLQPGLAHAWASESAGRIWHFDLLEDVAFHNGAPLTGADAAASLQACGLLAHAVGHKVTVELAVADPAFPFRLARDGMAIYRVAELETGGFAQNGTGLYRLTRFDPGRGFRGERVESHRKNSRAGWFDAVELVALSSDATRAEAIRDGFVDVADISDAYDLSGRSDVQLIFDQGSVVAALRNTITTATREGPAPLDDMRFVERWWVAS